MEKKNDPSEAAAARAMGALAAGSAPARSENAPAALPAPAASRDYSAAPLTATVAPVSAPTPCPYGPGTSCNAQGQEIAMDSLSFFRDGKPWMPAMGEFHYARYRRDEWRDELLKMKAGGIGVVSSYVFWIHHEEVQGTFDWSGQRSLRDFLVLCRELGLKAFVRMGPWCHGEVRNGGFPDWVEHSPGSVKKRTTDPAFMRMVEPFFKEQAAQMSGLLWKEGGPVIGVQLENEGGAADYLLELKRLVIASGVDVPFYAVTGWQGAVPNEGLLPLWGGYADGFWGGGLADYRRFFVPGSQRKPEHFPYACVEIGPGMMSSYGKRIKIGPGDVAAMSLSLLASGNNVPGYYMYHGGTNPDGKAPSLNENNPNQLPVKDYDFQTALGACGQVRDQYHLLRQQNIFVQNFGHVLGRTQAIFPGQIKQKDQSEPECLRWAVRSDGRTSFLFYINRQPYVPLADHSNVQFSLKTETNTLVLPHQPVTIPNGAYGVWPIGLDCDGVTLRYATAQLLCRLQDQNRVWYFLTAKDDIPVELSLNASTTFVTVDTGDKTTNANHVLVSNIKPGLNRAVRVLKADGGSVNFIILSLVQAMQFYRVSLGGRDRIVLYQGAVLCDGATLRLQTENIGSLTMAIFPPVSEVKIGDVPQTLTADGIFTRFSATGLRQPAPLSISVRQERTAGPSATSRQGAGDAPWPDPSVYAVDIPVAAAERRLLLSFHYIGDAARLYVKDVLFNDHYYNGDTLDIALWRIPVSDWPTIRLQILPYSDGLFDRLPAGARQTVIQAKLNGVLDRVTATVADQLEFSVSVRPEKAR